MLRSALVAPREWLPRASCPGFADWGGKTDLAGLVLRDLVLGVLLAVTALAVGAASLGNVDLKRRTLVSLRISGGLLLASASSQPNAGQSSISRTGHHEQKATIEGSFQLPAIFSSSFTAFVSHPSFPPPEDPAASSSSHHFSKAVLVVKHRSQSPDTFNEEDCDGFTYHLDGVVALLMWACEGGGKRPSEVMLVVFGQSVGIESWRRLRAYPEVFPSSYPTMQQSPLFERLFDLIATAHLTLSMS